KSVCINALITSLVYAHPPEKLKFLMIDPKMVELSMYASLPQLGLPVVTNHHKAASVLKWAVSEMDRRYKLLHANHARNVGDFNKKVEAKKPLKGPRETLATQAGVQRELPFDAEYTEGILPYVVLVVDELADLMLTVQHESETPRAKRSRRPRRRSRRRWRRWRPPSPAKALAKGEASPAIATRCFARRRRSASRTSWARRRCCSGA